ncbi:MAG: sigma-70 family RNA polymerase sigma factor [Fibrobacter sp.]|jgi:RNA polymerase sigma-70 factor (ECF subfamily)|nr:sigma-70 family RNA polymerase sigma factor [Fibrobacter sp.]
MNETDIVQELKKSNLAALETVWNENSKKILNLAFRILSDRDAAEDALMDIFVSIPKAIHRFREESSLSTWLYRLTVNECLMRIRKSKRRDEIEKMRAWEIETLSMGNAFEETEMFDGELLERALSELPALQRSMLWLKDAEGIDIRSLARIFEMPEGTLKSHLSRTRAKLRTQLHKEVYCA